MDEGVLLSNFRYSQLGVQDVADLVRYALQHGLVEEVNEGMSTRVNEERFFVSGSQLQVITGGKN